MDEQNDQANGLSVSSRAIEELLEGHTLQGERREIAESIKEILGRLAGGEIEVIRRQRYFHRATETTIERHVFRVRREGYPDAIVSVHDPILGPTGSRVPAESVSGADYAIEVPIDITFDRFLLVQVKRWTYGLAFKQLSSLGVVYDQIMGLAGRWTYAARLASYAHYVSRTSLLHNEFMLLEVYLKNTFAPVYIRVSDLLRTFHQNTYRLNPNFDFSQTGTLAQFPPAYKGRLSVYSEYVLGHLGITLRKDLRTHAFKNVLMFQTAHSLGRLNLLWTEITPRIQQDAIDPIEDIFDSILERSHEWIVE